MVEKSRKLWGTVIGIVFFAVCIISLSFAYYVWKSDNTNVDVGIHDGGLKYVYKNSAAIEGANLSPILDYTDSSYYTDDNYGKYLIYSDYTATNTKSDTYMMYAKINIISMSDALKSAGFKWVLLEKVGDSYSKVLKSGDFSNLGVGSNTIYSDIYIEPGEVQDYRFIVYIDGNSSDSSNMQSASIKANLELCDQVVPIYPITLDNQGADSNSGGTSMIYEKYGIGIYSDSTAKTNLMTTSSNGITNPTRTGYTFGGYYTASNGGGVNLIGANSYITSNFTNKYFSKASTLYAKWSINSYNFNVNLGSGINTFNISASDGTSSTSINSYNQQKPYNTEFTVSNVSSKTGYTYTGYALSGSLTEISGSSKDSIKTKLGAGNGTLTLNSSANTYNINYTLNGGNKGSNAPGSATYDTNITIDNPTKTITAVGNANGTGATISSSTSKAQTFAGWTGSNINTSTAMYGSSTSSITTLWSSTSTKVTSRYFKNLNPTSGSTVTLTANWTPVSFNLPTVSKTGYTCSWNTNSSGTGTTYASGASYTPTAVQGDINLYAICSANSYKISYTLNGGTSGSNAPTSANYGSVITIDNPTKTLTATGNVNGTGATIGSATSKAQTFAGWTASNINTSTAMYGSSSTNVSTVWSNTSTKVTSKYFKNLNATNNATSTLIANWTPVSFNLPTVSKTGYDCSWNTKTDGSGTTYASGASYTPTSTSENLILYARCSVNSYKISYTLNGGTSGSNAPTSASYDSTITIDNPTKTITAVGNANGTGATIGSSTSKAQTFAGWTASNLNTSTAKYGSSSTNVNTSWSSASTKVTSKYFKNLTSTSGATVTLTANWTVASFNLPTVSKTGYTCNWNTNSSGTGTTYASGASFTPTSSTDTTLNLYARCTASSYKISYTLNGGTSGSSAPTSANYDSVITIDNPTKTITAVGNANGTGATIGSSTSKAQTFAGWTASNLNTSTAKYGSSTYSVNTSWSSTSTKVTNRYFKNLTATANATVTLTANWTATAFNLPTVSKTGYTCSWNTNTSGTGTTYASGASFTPTSSTGTTLNLYAKCTINSYTLTVKPNGGTWNNKTTDSTFTQNYNTTKTIAVPTSSKYTVSFNTNGGSTVSSQTASKTFTGWTKTGGGSITSTTPVATASQTYTFGTSDGTLTASYSGGSITLPTPTKTGYTFDGWYTSSSGGTLVGKGGASYTPTSSTTLYAHWTAISYTITYSGGSGELSNMSTTQTVSYGSSFSIATPDHGSAFKLGYGFVGWTTKSDGSDDGYSWTGKSGTWNYVNGQNGVSNNKLTLYTRWHKNLTCASTGGTTTYMGHKWYTISNSNNICELALNETIGSGVAYNNSSGQGGNVFQSIQYYTDGYATIADDTDDGLIDTYDSNSGTSNGMSSGIYWISSGKVFNHGTVNYYKYSTEKTIAWGMVNTTDGTWNKYTSGNFSVPSSNGSSSNFSTTVSNSATQVTYSNTGYSTAAYNSTTHYSELWAHWFPDSSSDVSNSSKVYLNLRTGNFNSPTSTNCNLNICPRSANKIIVKICGPSSDHGKNITFSGVSTTKYHYNNAATGTDKDYSYPSSEFSYSSDTKMPTMTKYRDFVFAAADSSTNTDTTRTYDFANAANCKTYNQYTLTNSSYNISYRPHIKVKIVS